MDIFTLDFETFWDSKNYTLSKIGPIEYVRDPRFATQMVGVARNQDAPVVHHGVQQKVALDTIDWKNDVIIGHNMSGFDALILSEHFGYKPKHIWDTICMMRWCGISSISRERLSALDEILGIGEKQAGTVVSDGKHWPTDFTSEERDFFMRYCADDVDQCRKAAAIMLPQMTDDALNFMSLTARMATEPVFVLDEQMLEEYLRQLDAEAEEARVSIMELFHFDTVADFLKALRSKEKFAAMLRELGVEPPRRVSDSKTSSMRARGAIIADAVVYDYAFSKQDVDFLDLREHEDSRVRLLVETRLQFNSSVMRSRCETLLKFARMKKPLPVLLSAFKAHTSRYTAGSNGEHSSDGIQVQNLSKRNPAHRVLRKSIKAPAGYKIVSCDSSQIEARMLAWLSGQEDLLGHFRDGRDPYAEFGVHLNNEGLTAADIVEGKKRGENKCKFIRDLSKKFILSCGFGSGKDKVSQTLWAEGIRLAQTREEHAVIAAQHLQTYRNQHPFITSFWRLCGNVIEHMVAGGSGCFGGPKGDTFRYGPMPVLGSKEPIMSVMMPSGFALRYPGLRAQHGEKGVEYVYDKFLGRNRVATRIYSSLLTENLTQGIAFQLLMWQACRMNEAGIDLKCNIHDAWATVVPEAKAQATADAMFYHMRRLPDWAEGCPIDAEVEIGDDFTVI